MTVMLEYLDQHGFLFQPGSPWVALFPQQSLDDGRCLLVLGSGKGDPCFSLGCRFLPALLLADVDPAQLHDAPCFLQW